MRKSLMLLCALVMCVGDASADHIGVFRDPTGYYCTLENPPVGLPGFSLYVVHKFNSGSTGSHFKVIDRFAMRQRAGDRMGSDVGDPGRRHHLELRRGGGGGHGRSNRVGPGGYLHAGVCYCGTLATQEATWGAVKALYR